MNRITFPLIAWLALATGCSSFINKQAASSTYRILQKSTEAARRQIDLQLAREALPGGVLQLEAFSLASPDHRGFKREKPKKSRIRAARKQGP